MRSDLGRALAAIEFFNITGPHDGPREFTFPKGKSQRAELADFIFDVVDQFAARAVLDAPVKFKHTWE